MTKIIYIFKIFRNAYIVDSLKNNFFVCGEKKRMVVKGREKFQYRKWGFLYHLRNIKNQ